jgi:hypothetical protein
MNKTVERQKGRPEQHENAGNGTPDGLGAMDAGDIFGSGDTFYGQMRVLPDKEVSLLVEGDGGNTFSG